MWPWSSRYPTQNPENVGSSASSTSENSAVITYDYIVVGGGTAGCVLASRLTEDPNVTVLLLERGPILDSWISKVPLLSLEYRSKTSPTYKWNSSPVSGLKNQVVGMLGGKAMGGTSKVNAFLYTRQAPAEHNAWAAQGRNGWAYEDVEHLYVRSETSLSHSGKPHRGISGPWQNQACPEIYFDNVKQFVEATSSLGIPYLMEANNPKGSIVACVQSDRTIDAKSHRLSTFDAFLPLIVATTREAHLKICTEVIVSSIKVISTKQGLRAVGVYFERKTEPDEPRAHRYYASARREVILCAGSIATPQILMLSGIGPEAHLYEKEIPVVKNLPGVGLHLQDHYAVPVIYKVPLRDTLHALAASPFLALKEFVKYVFTGQGLFMAPNPQLLLFARSALLDLDMKTVVTDASQVSAYDPNNIPDIEIMPIPYNASHMTFDVAGGKGFFSLLTVLLQPKSTGTVRLHSTDPRVPTDCDLNFMAHEEDKDTMKTAIKLSLRIGRQMRENGYPLRDFYVPQSESDSDLDDFIVRGGGLSTYHYSSTCRMAPGDGSSPGVVDDELKVHGIQGLRIADASVFPIVPAAHLQAPTVMIAERCAELLKSMHG